MCDMYAWLPLVTACLSKSYNFGHQVHDVQLRNPSFVHEAVARKAKGYTTNRCESYRVYANISNEPDKADIISSVNTSSTGIGSLICCVSLSQHSASVPIASFQACKTKANYR